MDLRLIISFDENYEVTRVSYKDHERTWVRVPDAHTIIFGDNSAASRDRAKAFANAISTDDWKEYDGRRTRSERPESGDHFYQFLNHKLKLIYEDDQHLVYQAARKPRRENTRGTQPEQS